MGKFRLGKKMSHKHITRKADEWKQLAEERATVITQALMYNAALHKALQHELCTCDHGANKHLNPDRGNACSVADCTCEEFRSNWSRAFDAWQKEAWAYLDREHAISHYLALDTEDPMHELRLTEAFDGGIKAEAHAQAKAKLEQAKAENEAEAAKAQEEAAHGSQG